AFSTPPASSPKDRSSPPCPPPNQTAPSPSPCQSTCISPCAPPFAHATPKTSHSASTSPCHSTPAACQTRPKPRPAVRSPLLPPAASEKYQGCSTVRPSSNSPESS